MGRETRGSPETLFFCSPDAIAHAHAPAATMHAAARARPLVTAPAAGPPRPPPVLLPNRRAVPAWTNDVAASSSASSSSSPGGRPLRFRKAAASNSDKPGGLDEAEIQALLRKYDTAASPETPTPQPRGKQAPPPKQKGGVRKAAPATAAPPAGNGTFLLCALCLAVFVADNVLHLPGTGALHLVHGSGRLLSPWPTLFSHAFAHANWQHLSANLFPLLVFGKLVEETEGAAGVLLAYLLTAAGAALASVWLTPGPAVVSVGASGAVFGLFSIAVLTRFSADPRRLLEFFVLGQFVVSQVLGEARAQAAGGTLMGGLAVSHVAHLAGALAGVLLVLSLRAVPEPPTAPPDA